MAASKFNVVVDIPLTKAQKDAINKDIQAVVMKNIARLDNNNLGRKIKLPKDWIGIWIKDFKTMRSLQESALFRSI